VSVVVPALDEGRALGATLLALQQLRPPAQEIIVVDGGSRDRTRGVAREHGVRCIRGRRGRATQMNRGARAATGDLLWFVHADTHVPEGGVASIRAALDDPGTVLGGFSPRIVSEAAPGRTLHFMSANNWAKTFYGPLVGRPVSFARGLRCLFGDQAMFCRRADFWRSGGFDEDLPLMEDADLCLRMHMSGPAPGAAAAPPQRGLLPPRRRRGRVRMLPDAVRTSGRRIESMGCGLYATYVHARLGLGWYLCRDAERPATLRRLCKKYYPDTRNAR